MEKLLRENREKLSEADAKPVEEAIEEAKSALAGGTSSRCKRRARNSRRASHKVAEVMYKAARRAERRRAPAGPGGMEPGRRRAEQERRRRRRSDRRRVRGRRRIEEAELRRRLRGRRERVRRPPLAGADFRRANTGATLTRTRASSGRASAGDAEAAGKFLPRAGRAFGNPVGGLEAAILRSAAGAAAGISPRSVEISGAFIRFRSESASVERRRRGSIAGSTAPIRRKRPWAASWTKNASAAATNTARAEELAAINARWAKL